MTQLEEEISAVFAAKGQTAALMRGFDWSSTSLGTPEHWPQSLRSVLSICLNALYPVCIFWGPEHVLLYNDAWSPILGDKHAWALGRTAREVWPEIWDLIGARFAKVTGEGEAIWLEDEFLPLRRHGYTEEGYFNGTISPIRGEGGAVAGIFHAVTGTGDRAAGRRARLLRKLAEGTAAARSAHEVYARAAEILASGADDVPFCLIYQLGGGTIRLHAQLAAAAGIAVGSSAWPPIVSLEDDCAFPGTWPFSRALKTGGLAIVEDLASRFGASLPGGAWPESVRSAAVIPIHLTADTETPAAFLILGLDPRQAFNEDYRSFVELAAASLKDAVARARTYDEERRPGEHTIVDFTLSRVHEGAFLVDSSGRFLYVNDEATRSLGYSREELLGMGVADIDPDFPPELWPKHWRETAKEGSRTFESRHKSKDGRNLPVEINSNYFKYNGHLYSMALVRDITERKRTEEERARAAEQQAILEFALNRVHEAAFLVDKDSRILYVNHEAARSLGYSRKELLDICVADIDPDFPPARWPSYWREVTKEGSLTFESRHRTKDGRIFPVEIRSNYFEFGGRAYNIAFARDITGRKQQEQERAAHLKFLESMDRINRAMQGTNDLEKMMGHVLGAVLGIFGCDRAWLIHPCDPEAGFWRVAMERAKPEYRRASALGRGIPSDEHAVRTFRAMLSAGGPLQFHRSGLPKAVNCFGIKSQMAMAIHPKTGKPWLFGLHQCSREHIWTHAEERLFQEVGRRLTDGLTSFLTFRGLQTSEEFARTVLELSADCIKVTDPRGRIEFMNGAGRRLMEIDDYESVKGRLLDRNVA